MSRRSASPRGSSFAVASPLVLVLVFFAGILVLGLFWARRGESLPLRWSAREARAASVCGGRAWSELPGWGVEDLDADLQPGADGRAPSARRSAELFGARVFSFGITYGKNHRLAALSDRVWARDMPGFVWYSTEPDEALRGRMIVLRHCRSPTYENMTSRMLEVWAHVWSHWYGYAWYMRLWDDNWVDVNGSLPAVMRTFGMTEDLGEQDKVHFARIGESPVYSPHMFPGGGAGSLLSGAGMRAWLGPPTTLSGLVACAKWLDRPSVAYVYAEDVHLGECQHRSGVRLVQTPGFHALGLGTGEGIPSWDALSEEDLRCRRDFQEFPSSPRGPIVTMHYMKEPQMLRVWRIMAKPCSDEG